MANDSSTGGYLAPGTSANLEGAALDDLLQSLVAGVTGLSGQYVRPRWQQEPSSPPGQTTDWAAISIQRRKNDTFPAVIHNSVTEQDTVFRQQELEVLLSLYGPNADLNAQIFCEGIFIEQNREALRAQAIQLVACEDPIVAPELVNDRWRRRVDVFVRFRRALGRTYAIRNLVGASGEITAAEPILETSFTVETST